MIRVKHRPPKNKLHGNKKYIPSPQLFYSGLPNSSPQGDQKKVTN